MMFDEQKFREMVLYVCEKCENHAVFGKTKLAKLLAYADFGAYATLGQPISGTTYIKLEHGPAPRDLPAALSFLTAKSELAKSFEMVGSYQQTRFVATTSADTSVFSPEELAIIDGVIDKYKLFSGSALAERSHVDFVGWNLVDEGDEVMYQSAFLSPQRPLSEAEIARGQEIAEELKLLAA